MRLRTTVTARSRFILGLASFALLAGPGALAGSAAAAPAAAPIGCVAGGGATNRWHGAPDTDPVTTALKKRVAGEVAAPATGVRTSRSAGSTLPARVHVPVVIHVIHGRHKNDRNLSRAAARRLFYALRAGFNGRQDASMAPTGIIFDFVKVTVSRNDDWFHASPSSRADRQMKRKLHHGKRRVLNVYLNNERSQGQQLLGFARFPWQVGAYPLLDGVTINVETLPGGRARGYNLGDTVIHETGHWFGLFHTFEGGCDSPGDYVNDTAPEAEPSFACELTRDTCPTPLPDGWVEGDPLPQPVPDPVTNFMDYSYDRCMDHFTPGQRTRMMTLFMRYRYGR